MRVFVYCRKSTDREDRQILSTDAQRRLLLEHAGRQGFAVVETYVENQTAYKVGRPLFNAMLGRLEKGEADGILTYHLTRLARNSYDGGRLIYMMDEGTIRRIATPEKAYVDTADDKFMMQIHFAMAKKSSDDTSQFVRRDVESKLLRGEYPGKVPPGYLNITRAGHIAGSGGDPEKERLLRSLGRPLRREEVDPIDGPLVRRLFEEAATGALSLPRLRTFSHGLGLRARRSGRMLSKNAIRKLLGNPYYYGAIAYNGTVYDDALLRERTGNPEASIQHEPLVSRELFERVQEAVFGRRRRGRYRRHRFPFGGGLLRCGECGSPVTAERQKGHVYYHCTGSGGACSQRRWTREESLDAQFSAILARLRVPQRFLDYALRRLRSAHTAEAKVADVARRGLQSRVNAAQQRLDSLLQLKLSPSNRTGELLSDEEYLRQKREIRKELDLLQERLTAFQAQSANWVDDCERFFDFTQRLAEKFGGSTEDNQTLLLLICSNLTLKDQIVAADYQDPYASLARFELAGGDDDFPSEPEEMASASEKALESVHWLHLLTAIRTYTLPPIALRDTSNAAA